VFSSNQSNQFTNYKDHHPVSSINGDKSRHQINRKRAVIRRMKIRKLVEEKGQPAAATDAKPSGARRPSSGQSR